LGIDEARAHRAAAWSGVIVLKKLHRLLQRHGADLRKVRPLIASLRIYDGPAHVGLPSAFPDITEVMGTRMITVFPNIRRALDAAAPLELRPGAIDEAPPQEALDVLRHSEVFRQAYFVGDPAWGEDDESLRPRQVLRLEDEAATFAWTPIRNTLTEFMNAYDTFVRRIEGRRRLVRLRATRERGVAVEADDLQAAVLDAFPATVHDAWELAAVLPPDPSLGAALTASAVQPAVESIEDPATRELAQRVQRRHVGAASGVT